MLVLSLLKPLLLRSGSGKNNQGELPAVELAYLCRKGDAGFALIVLVFDLVLREIKAEQITTGTQLIVSPYEDSLKSLVKRTVTDWGTRKVEEVLKVDPRDKIAVLRKLPLLAKLIKSGLSDTIKEIIKDPKNLRKYISVQGLMRIAAEIGASGYKQQLAADIHNELLKRGLLLEDQVRKQKAKMLLAIFIVSELVFASLLLTTGESPTNTAIILVFSIMAALLAKLCIFAREFIPFYSDLKAVLVHVPRLNLRVRVLAFVINAISTIASALSIIVLLTFFTAACLTMTLTSTLTSTHSYLVLTAQMLAQAKAIDYIFESYNLYLNDCPSTEGETIVTQAKRHYRNFTTLDVLRSTLANPSYDPVLTYLLAIYGLETLLFL